MRPWAILLPLAILSACSSEITNTSMHGAARQTNIPLLSGKHEAVLITSMGRITLELDADTAPKAVTNFIELARNGFYDNLTFHRVMKDFMIQGGDPRGDGSGGASVFGRPFEDEITDTPLERGAIAMANRGPNSNLSQFFIVHRKDGAPWLQGKHTVFGKVVKGMDVVDRIAQVECDTNYKPRKPVVFQVEVE